MFSHGVSQVPRRDGLSHEHSEKVDIPAQRAGLENWLRAWSLLALSAGSFGGLAQQSQWRPASLGSCPHMGQVGPTAHCRQGCLRPVCERACE